MPVKPHKKRTKRRHGGGFFDNYSLSSFFTGKPKEDFSNKPTEEFPGVVPTKNVASSSVSGVDHILPTDALPDSTTNVSNDDANVDANAVANAVANVDDTSESRPANPVVTNPPKSSWWPFGGKSRRRRKSAKKSYKKSAKKSSKKTNRKSKLRVRKSS